MLITFTLVTAALLLGTVCDLLVLLSRSDRRAELTTRWKTPQLFLGKVLPRFRQELSRVSLWAGTVLFLGQDFFLQVMAQLFPQVPQDSVFVVWAGLLCLVVVIRIACLPFSFQQLAFLFPLFLLAWLIILSTPGNAYFDMVAQPICLLLFFMQAPLRRVMKLGFGIKAIYMALTIVLCLTGRIADHWNWLTDDGRYALGFGHYNVLGMAVFELLLLYVCLRFAHWRWWDTLLLPFAAVFVWLVPQSRTASLAILALWALVLIGRWLPKLLSFRLIQAGLSSLWGLLAVASLLCGRFLYIHPFLQRVNDLLSNRLFIIHSQLLGPSFQWFGAVSNGSMATSDSWVASIWEQQRLAGLYNYNLIDNGYAFCLYMAGPFWLAFFCIAYGLLIWRFLRSGRQNWPLAFLLTVLALYTVTEREFANFWALILLGNLFCTKKLSLD